MRLLWHTTRAVAVLALALAGLAAVRWAALLAQGAALPPGVALSLALAPALAAGVVAVASGRLRTHRARPPAPAGRG